ncbi:MAG: prolyl oligopeptidase family serine peptidase [Deltaproteobacteria bacterium]|nr:prolyl oligopeptidase family serine peptidase [Deltaproteobacteria bacterium]
MRTGWFLGGLILVACGHATAPTTTSAPPSTPPDAATAVDATPVPAGPPVARTVDVSETLFGTTVADPYRWMETERGELTAWLTAQGAYTRDFLARSPGRAALLARIEALGNATGAPGGAQLAGGRLFYYYAAPGEQVPKLMVRERGADRVLIDPAALGDADHHASLNNVSPSPDGARVAYNIALGGGEISTIRVLDVATGKDLPDAIERVWGEFRASWLPDGKAFMYTQMAAPADGVDPMLGMRVRLHVLGAPVGGDPELLGAAGRFPIAPHEFPVLTITPGTGWVVATAGGPQPEERVAVARLADLDRTGAGKTPWVPVADYADGVVAYGARGDRLYLATFAGASNQKVVSVPFAQPALAKARVEVAEDPQQAIVGWAIARDAIYLHRQVNGLSHLYRLPWKGALGELALPFPGWIDELAADPARDGVTVGEQGWTRPSAYFAYDPATRKVAPIGLAAVTNADYTGIVADEVEATSADGTKVPLSILRRADLVRDGAHPAILYGYGGYGISSTPNFSPTRLAWLERGGVFAVCHVRGGGEKGHQWQVDGTHEHKLNGVHDLEACAQYLATAQLSSTAHTFAQGGSMGGILIGRAITERPELFAAANIQVGMNDPLRVLAAENGADQLSELGDPRTEAGFRAIHAMSPYAHATAQAYPATIFTVGLNDGRVAPWMTGKLAARMQAVTTSGKPVLIRTEADAGHGIGSTRSQAFVERADVWTFFLAMSGDPAFALRGR